MQICQRIQPAMYGGSHRGYCPGRNPTFKKRLARRHALSFPPLSWKIRRRRPCSYYPSHCQHHNFQCRGIEGKNLNLNSIRIQILPSDPSSFHSIMLDEVGVYHTIKALLEECILPLPSHHGKTMMATWMMRFHHQAW